MPIASVVLCLAVAIITLGLGSTPADALVATPKLGTPPVPCPGGEQIFECEYGQRPNYMAITYNGGMRISPQVIHEGASATETFYPKTVTCLAYRPCAESWGWRPPGEATSECGLGNTSCTFKATEPFASPYPPSVKKTGWSGGWQVSEVDICGGNGCANAADYYYEIPGNLRGLSGTVVNVHGEPLLGAQVTVSGSGGSETTEVTPEAGFYSFILHPGIYSVSVSAASGTQPNPVQCSGQVQGQTCVVNLEKNDGTASFTQGESVSILGTPSVAEPEEGSTPEQFKLALTEASSSPITVDFETADGSATAAANNYQPVTGSVTIQPGERSTPISVEVLPGSGLGLGPKLDYYVRIKNILGDATLNQAASATVGSIDVPTIAGEIVGPLEAGGQRKGVANVLVKLTGTADTGQKVERTEETKGPGTFSFHVDPGKYYVTPVHGKTASGAPGKGLGGFAVLHCDGVEGKGLCNIEAAAGSQTYTANFTGGFLLSGSVFKGAQEGVPGAEVKIEGTEETTTVTTGPKGEFEKELAPGEYKVSVPHEGGEGEIHYVPQKSADCLAERRECVVNLNQNRSVTFGECVVPNPNGSALPEKTPTPIPGAQTDGNLEAVGCFREQSNGTATTKLPVRLDGLDVEPVAGSTITVNPNATVTSSGAVRFGVGKAFLVPLEHLNLNFQAANIAAEDLGAGNPTFGLNARVFGVPFSLTSGSSLQTLVPPWTSSLGQTALSLDLQLPTTLNATEWNTTTGSFENNKQSVPSLGATATLTATNRKGLIDPTICAKFTGGEFKLWNTEYNTSWIKQATACYDFQEEQWTLAGLFQIPEAWKAAKLFNQVNGSVSWKSGFRWSAGSIQVDGINKMIGNGIFLQRLGANFHRDFTNVPPTESNFGVNAGFSFGPQANAQTLGALVKLYPALNGAELLSFNGEGQIAPWANPASWKLKGDVLLLRDTPLQFELAGGYLNIYGNGRVDTGGAIRLALPIVHWGVAGQMAGFWEPEQEVLQISGNDTVTGPWKHEAKAEGLINNSGLVLCFSNNSGYTAGGIWNWQTNEVNAFEPGTCDIGNYTIKPPGASASAVGSRSSYRLELPSHMSGTTIAVRGTNGPPLVKLDGPGFRLTTPTATRDVLNNRVFLYKDQAKDTTYLTIYRPRGGTWRVSALSGSPPIVSVLAARPAPQARLTAHVSPGQCTRMVSYRARIPSGEKVALYSENGAVRTFLGDAHHNGHLSFKPDVTQTGKGQIIGLEMRGKQARRIIKIASFHSSAVLHPARVGHLRLKGSQLSWTGPCGSLSYTITITEGKSTTTLTSSASHVTLPALHAGASIAVSARGPGGAGPASTIKAKL